MYPRAVIEQFDVIEDRRPRCVAGLERVMPRQFVLEIREEAFDDGVVVAISLLAHALDHAVCLQELTIGGGEIELALVAVVDEPR